MNTNSKSNSNSKVDNSNCKELFFKINKKYFELFSYSNKILFLMTYFYFSKDKMNMIKDNIEHILSVSGYSTSNRNQQSISSDIYSGIKYLYESEFIKSKSIYCSNIDSLTMKKMFVFDYNYDTIYESITSGFVIITLNEFMTILRISQENNLNAFTMFNIFIFIKSKISLNSNIYETCMCSYKKISSSVEISTKTIQKYLSFLIDNNLLYCYNCYGGEAENQYKNYYIYAIKEYDSSEIEKIFKFL